MYLCIGNSSCGPDVLKKYSIDKGKKHTLHLQVAINSLLELGTRQTFENK